METSKKYKIGSFLISAIPVTHNVLNYAYLIEHNEFGKLVFCTDATRFPYKIKDLNHLIIEANYDEGIILDKLCENKEIRSQSENHMEIRKTIKAIEQNVNPKLNNIVLCHLSDGLSDEAKFKQMVFDEFGIMPFIADKGLVINLDKEDF